MRLIRVLNMPRYHYDILAIYYNIAKCSQDHPSYYITCQYIPWIRNYKFTLYSIVVYLYAVQGISLPYLDGIVSQT